MTRDWNEWHLAYETEGSSLHARLLTVRSLITSALEEAPPGPVRVLSLCAGDGRDIVAAAAAHARRADVRGRLVELDPRLATAARCAAAAAGVSLDVVEGDAGDTSNLAGGTPADLLLLCGIFGNIDDADIRTTIESCPALCSPGASIIWTRHRRPPDITPQIVQWFETAGCPSSAFVSPGEGGFAVGAQRCTGAVAASDLPKQLFRFRDDLW